MIPPGEVILVDDEKDILEACRQTFELEGYQVRTFTSGNELLPSIRSDWPGVIISDVRMPHLDGLTLLKKIHAIAPDIPVIMMTGHGDVPMAIEAIRSGAYDFLEKPAPPEYLLDVTRRALETRRLFLENQALKKKLTGYRDIESIILGTSEPIVKLRQAISALSSVDVDVLLVGETGVGKELAAHCLHDFSERHSERFVPLNCGAIPANLVESELFGHERGAFTSASDRRIGKIELAHRGTLFLDEIESMPFDIQVKLLRTLQERTIERVGSNQQISVDFRIIAATKVNLRDAVSQGNFREDLFYRLNVARIPIPPLRERGSDIMLLLKFFFIQMAERFNCKSPSLTDQTVSLLQRYGWPGNVRELKNVAQQLTLNLPLDLAENPVVVPKRSSDSRGGLDTRMRDYETQIITDALERNDWRIEKTAQELGVPRKKLYLRMQKYGIQRN